jgi:hypothetical protein
VGDLSPGIKLQPILPLFLEIEYGLNSTEAAVVLGFALKYDIADLVGPEVSEVAKLPKKTLAHCLRARRPDWNLSHGGDLQAVLRDHPGGWGTMQIPT